MATKVKTKSTVTISNTQGAVAPIALGTDEIGITRYFAYLLVDLLVSRRDSLNSRVPSKLDIRASNSNNSILTGSVSNAQSSILSDKENKTVSIRYSFYLVSGNIKSTSGDTYLVLTDEDNVVLAKTNSISGYNIIDGESQIINWDINFSYDVEEGDNN